MTVTAITLFLIPVAGIYCLAALVCWMIALVRANGLVFEPGRVLQLYRPMIIAFTIGMFPTAILSGILMSRNPGATWPLAISAAGLVVTGILIQRDLMTKVATPARWRRAIALVTVIGVLASGWLALHNAGVL